MRTATQTVLVIAILVLGYLLFQSIMDPIRFLKEKDKRYGKTIERLKAIRTAEVAFKTEKGHYTASFDSLIGFIKNGEFRVVKKYGMISDSLLQAGMTEKMAIKKGIIRRDTVLVPILDSLFGKKFIIDSIRYVPFTKGAQFQLGTSYLETGKVKVNVFEASVENDVLLKDMDRQLVINLNDERKKMTGFPGLRVGSLTEANNNAGNWE